MCGFGLGAYLHSGSARSLQSPPGLLTPPPTSHHRKPLPSVPIHHHPNRNAKLRHTTTARKQLCAKDLRSAPAQLQKLNVRLAGATVYVQEQNSLLLHLVKVQDFSKVAPPTRYKSKKDIVYFCLLNHPPPTPHQYHQTLTT